MRPDIGERIVKPSDCAIAFALPLSQAAFRRDTAAGNSKEFARKFGSWDRYYSEVVRHFEAVRPEMTRLRANLYCGVTLNGFAHLLNQDRFAAVTLFAHWRGEGDHRTEQDSYDEANSAIEFSDGFSSITAIVDRVPTTFAGVLDLCVCHPRSLFTSLHRDRPDCVVKYVDAPAIPRFWIYFYLALFKHLAGEDTNYLQAVTDVIKLFRKRNAAL